MELLGARTVLLICVIPVIKAMYSRHLHSAPVNMDITRTLVLAFIVCVGGYSATACEPDSRLPNPEDKHSFFLCGQDGNFHIFSCPDGLHFFPDIQMCDWPADSSTAPNDLGPTKGSESMNSDVGSGQEPQDISEVESIPNRYRGKVDVGTQTFGTDFESDNPLDTARPFTGDTFEELNTRNSSEKTFVSSPFEFGYKTNETNTQSEIEDLSSGEFKLEHGSENVGFSYGSLPLGGLFNDSASANDGTEHHENPFSFPELGSIIQFLINDTRSHDDDILTNKGTGEMFHMKISKDPTDLEESTKSADSLPELIN